MRVIVVLRRGGASRHRGRPRVCRAETAAREAAMAYHKGFSEEVQMEVEGIENRVREQRSRTSHSQAE